MPIDERDYMRERLEKAFPTRNPWWSRFKLMPTIAIATAVLGLGSAAIWFARDAGGLFPRGEPGEGTLRVNINTATLVELESIPGIGSARAQQIVARRPFKSVDELVEISGIGRKSLESLRPFVKIEGETQTLR
jgi:competence protein ComEA